MLVVYLCAQADMSADLDVFPPQVSWHDPHTFLYLWVLHPGRRIARTTLGLVPNARAGSRAVRVLFSEERFRSTQTLVGPRPVTSEWVAAETVSERTRRAPSA